jgi:hypothetical protein
MMGDIREPKQLTTDMMEDDQNDHERDYKKDTIVRPKQVIYARNFMTRRRRRRRRRRNL